MATPTLVATAGAADANTYATLVEAEAYYDTQLYSTDWSAATDDEKNKSLLFATRLIDEQIVWAGFKATEAQSLRWPREALLDQDGFDVDNDTIPQFLINAVSELGGYLIGSNRTAESSTKGFSRMKAGELELVIDKSDRPAIIPSSVWQMLRPYGSLISSQPAKVYRT